MIRVDCEKLNIPDEPGVYFFRDRAKEILYIGKATSLKDRVKSYFSKDLIFTRGQGVVKMVEDAKTVTWVTTDSVLEAYILETQLIKKYLPPVNVIQKDDKSFNFIVITKEEYPQVLKVRGKDVPTEFPPKKRLYVIGPFPDGSTLKEGIKIIRKLFPWRDNKCEPCLPAGRRDCRPCFNRQLGLCPGVCTGEITEDEYKTHIKNLILFFEGKKRDVLKNLDKEMKAYAKRQEFERAENVKRTIFALEHIQDISLIKEDPSVRTLGNFRIESYDIAHMGGKEMTGVMVVVEDGKVKKSDYRKFRIRTIPGSDDTGALKEILSRRFNHDEWPAPQLIVVDGGLAQRNAAEEVLEARALTIPVVSVVKDERHKPRAVEGDGELAQKYEKDILLGNAEAHRFAITYHKKLRRKRFLP
jgi:excinuclease ABC subunit C